MWDEPLDGALGLEVDHHAYAGLGRNENERRSHRMNQGPRVGRYLIYGLLDPRDHALRYIGKTHLRRERRLERHIEAAAEGRTAPVSHWIRELDAQGLRPHIFVLRRVPPEEDWREAERSVIELWNAWPLDKLPTNVPPQTRKSVPTEIRSVSLLNVKSIG